MKKCVLSILLTFNLLLVVGCSNVFGANLQGIYIGTTDSKHNIYFTFNEYEGTFSAYVDGVAIGSGSYEDEGNGKCTLWVHHSEEVNITLDKRDFFSISIGDLNNGEPITLYNESKALSYYSGEASEEEVEELKPYIGEWP